jgi:glycosyltransferase 2 family protein
VRDDKPDIDHGGVLSAREAGLEGPAIEAAHWRAARYVIGLLCAVGALYACAVNVQWAQVLDAFRRASLPWTAAAAASVLLTLALVTLRWGLLVGASPSTGSGFKTERHGTRWRVLWDSVVLGQAVNILMPLRFGEGARLAVASRGLNVRVGRVMVGLALERAFDVATFATIVLLLIVSGWMPDAFGGLLPAAVTVTFATLGVALLFVRFSPEVLAWLRRRVGMLAPAAAWIETQELAVRGGWTDITRRHQLAMTALLTALIPVTAAVTNLLVLRGFSLPVPVVTAFVLLIVLQIGTAVVSVPGNIGVFHYLTVVTLAAWGVPRATALATAVVLHAVSLGPKVLLAAFSQFPGRSQS